MKKTKIASLLLTAIMLFVSLSLSVFASTEDGEASWKGAMNFNDENNYVTTASSVTAPNMTEMKWSYPLNTTAISGGAYYAGSTVIADGYIYASGGGKLHKINAIDGSGTIINENAGSTESFYDYLCFADGILLLSQKDSITAYSLDGKMLGNVSGSFAEYHPIQYHNGHIICNGFIYKLNIEDDNVSFTQIGNTAIGGDAFNWSSGAFINDIFYVAAKTTIYAVDYKTGTIIDSYVFDAERTATKNVQGGLCFDTVSGRLFWATYTYNSFLHSIKVTDEGFDKESYISEDAGQKSVATPIVFNGRVYLAGQQGRICVHDADDLSKVYDYVTLGGGKVQGTPILSTADEKIRIYIQCSNGHLYLFTDNGESGTATKLADTANYTNVSYPYAGYESYAMDEKGNIYCYNESGYLFCFGKSQCEKPTITKDLSTCRIKYGTGTKTEPLSIEAEVSHGTLTYLWQSSLDGEIFSDIDGATQAIYTPSSEVAGTMYYRCIITNTDGEYTATQTSSTAHILVKELSNSTTLNAIVGKGNSVTATSNIAVASEGTDGVLYVENCDFDVKNIFLGVADEGSISKVEVIYGAGNDVPKKYSVSNSVYPERYYKSTYTKPIVAKITVLAEDGISEDEKYLIVSEKESETYITKINLESESEYFSDKTITFTAVNQTAQLSISSLEKIGNGETYNPAWEWTSSDSNVASVDENGVVKCIGSGSAVITAKHQCVSASVNVVSVTDSEHKRHSYSDGVCTICTHKQPEDSEVYFSLIDSNNKAAISFDGNVEIYKTQISVGDIDLDGIVTLNDAFINIHTLYSQNGALDYVYEESQYGYFITRLWGVDSSNVAYIHNDKSAYSLLTPIAENDSITAYFYRDTTNYSDVYTYIIGNKNITAGVDTDFELKGICSSGNIIPEGASINVIDENGEIVATATVDNGGKFNFSIDMVGEYILEACGETVYTGTMWDTATGTYIETEFTRAPIVMSRFSITVLPYVEKTVYVTIGTKNGEFAVNKNGDDMWYFPIKATDNPEAPDGVVTISELLQTAHKNYHINGADAFYIEESKYGDYITRLWGENNGGNCLYYFNNIEMDGMGTKTGTNGRVWDDKLLDTIIENDDTFTIYSIQATDYKKADLYTYFELTQETAKSGKKKTFTLKSVPGYGNNTVVDSIVKVYDKNGNEAENLSTTVSADGTFSVTFPKQGTYTVDVRTNGTNYISPARCIVNVSGSGSSSSQDTITVYFTLFGDTKHGDNKEKHTNKKGNLEEWLSKTKITLDKGSTVMDAIKTVLDDNGISYTAENGYISEVNGLSEFDNGTTSGWMYQLNGKYPDISTNEKTLSNGDKIVLHYTDDYNAEKKKSSSGTSTSVSDDKDKKEDDQEKNENSDANDSEKADSDATSDILADFTENTYPDIKETDWFYNDVKFTHQKGLLKGTDKGFEPNLIMTRAMLVTVIWRMEGSPESTEDAFFDDVKKNDWYFDAVGFAKTEGIINGIDESTFGADLPVTREQAVTIIFRYIKNKDITAYYNRGTSINDFPDSDSVSDYAKEAMEWAIDNGIIKGRSGNLICPKESLTRAETAAILTRLCKEILK